MRQLNRACEVLRCGGDKVGRSTYATNSANRILLEGLGPEELLALIEHIAQRLHPREERMPQPLYGIWREKFPEDADIDATLKEVRHQWQGDFEEFEE